MYTQIIDKDFVLIAGTAILVYILLIMSPKMTKLQLKGNKKRLCRTCPSATNPWRFALLVFVLATIGYFIYKIPTVQKMMS